MTVRLGNAVLRAVKKINGRIQSELWEQKRGAYRRQMIENLITELFGILSRAACAEENKLTHAYRTGELSKQAQKELAMKRKNSENHDWEEAK
jgi:hypothetical protein